MRYRRPKRIIKNNLVYFVTVVTKNRYPYFRDEVLCELFIEELKVCKRLKGFELYAFCILEEHVHLMMRPGEKYDLSKIMKSLKENFSRDANKILTELQYPVGATSTSRLQIDKYIKIHMKGNIRFIEFQWQKSYMDHYIRNENDFTNHFHYTIYNHLKHGYSKKYKFTSLNYNELIDQIED